MGDHAGVLREGGGSPPVPRAPARVRRVAGAYLRLLFHGGTIAVLCLGSVEIVGHWAIGERSILLAGKPFNDLRQLAVMMFFLPFLQWQGEGGRATSALPLDRTQHDLVRVGCGTAWAVACIAIPTVIETLRIATIFSEDGPGFIAESPIWYPVSLVAVGITLYLLGSAVLLWSERPGRVLILLTAASFVVPGLLPSGDGVRPPLPSIAWMHLLVAIHSNDFEQLSTPEQIAAVVLPLGLACALVYAAARLDRTRAWAGVTGRVGAILQRRLRRRPSLGSARPAARPTGLRRPPSAVAITRRHFVLLRRRMTWPMLIALVFAWDAARLQMEAGGITPVFPAFTGIYATVAICWPLLAWMDEHGPSREFDEALPVGQVKKRILHAAAGAAWLLLVFLLLVAGRVAGAVAAGTLTSPLDAPAWLWLGVPCGALVLYFTGTIPTLLAHRPALTVFLLFMTVTAGDFVARSINPHPLSPLRAIAPFLNDRQGVMVNHAAWWSYTATAFWLALCGAAAVLVLAVSDPAGRRRFPTVRDVARSLRSQLGQGPQPSPMATPGAGVRSREREPDYIPRPP